MAHSCYYALHEDVRIKIVRGHIDRTAAGGRRWERVNVRFCVGFSIAVSWNVLQAAYDALCYRNWILSTVFFKKPEIPAFFVCQNTGNEGKKLLYIYIFPFPVTGSRKEGGRAHMPSSSFLLPLPERD